MKITQFFLFAFCFLTASSFVQAQLSTVYLAKGLLGDEKLKIAYTEDGFSPCEASVYYQGFLDEDYQKFRTKSCNELGAGKYQLKLVDKDNKPYSLTISQEEGVVLTYWSDGIEIPTIFGYEFALSSGKNKFSMIIAGKNSYFAFTIPDRKYDNETFVLSSKADGNKFNKQFQQLVFGEINALEFTIKREWDLLEEDDVAKIKITTPDEESFIVEFSQNGKSTFFTLKR